MKKQRHPEAYNYLRLIWQPARNQRVTYKGLRTRIEECVPGQGIKVAGVAQYLMPGETTWRPTPSDFDAVLTMLEELFQYREKQDGLRQVIGLKCGNRTIPLRGRPAQLLSYILSCRQLDSKIGITINRIFDNACGLIRTDDHVVRTHEYRKH